MESGIPFMDLFQTIAVNGEFIIRIRNILDGIRVEKIDDFINE